MPKLIATISLFLFYFSRTLLFNFSVFENCSLLTLFLLSVHWLLSKGFQGYFGFIKGDIIEDKPLIDVTIACEFLDVFLDELSGLPPDCEKKFLLILFRERRLFLRLRIGWLILN